MKALTVKCPSCGKQVRPEIVAWHLTDTRIVAIRCHSKKCNFYEYLDEPDFRAKYKVGSND